MVMLKPKLILLYGTCLFIISIFINILITTNIHSGPQLKNIDSNLHSTVLINTESTKEGKISGTGSGFIFSKDGYIITNHHVIEDKIDTGYVFIEFYKKENIEYKAEIIGYDEIMDLAIIKIDDEFHFNSIKWADEVILGETAYAIGHPQRNKWSLTRGVISHPGRYPLSPWQRMLQSDAIIMPGSSGGGLFNRKGELIGINTLFIKNYETQAWSMSIHIFDVRWFIDRILAYGEIRRPSLNIAAWLDKERNLLKIKSKENTVLDESGFKGGYLISIDNIEIRDHEDLVSFLKSKIDGDIVTLKVDEEGVLNDYTFELLPRKS